MKKIFTLLAVALLTIGTLSAQATAGKGDIKVFALEMGTGFNYNVGTSDTNATQTFSALFGFSDAVQAGFTVIKGSLPANSFNMVKLAVFPVSDLSINLLFGSDAASDMASGFGIGYNIMRNTSTPNITTILQLGVQYLFTTDIAEGNLGIGANLKIGF